MKALKFTLKGKTAFFKKPDVNSYFYFTYGHIHKIALMGVLGAIMGYGGYNQQARDENKVFPEFYEKLMHIRVSIVPKLQKQDGQSCNGQEKGILSVAPARNAVQRGYFNKKIQNFNNTVGYANADGNLIVSEQWLEDPCWDIYLLQQGEVEEAIAKWILDSKAIFIPYLGKNDHPADIEGAELVELQAADLKEPFHMESLYLKDYFKAYTDTVDDGWVDFRNEEQRSYKYEERLPIALEETTNQYITTPFVFTNGKVVLKEICSAGEVIVLRHAERCLNFF
ncbi:MAG TPA: CRISPR-associated protein Cas5 [Clostridiales bacterium]|nr:CRISPR-associated protein Cas5 [Clostridiales bacterium]